ncbi:hypothetical protein GUITHDRAFT_163519 [Guillardia theta CCMP2712]|uniref:HMG box domain-containing protein n=1 Tax=Guillardia theta (strain CCMP2712) TaxID=905079 RepID=L1J982_GUITC|nr:hypothetical protein GUITHDRAFT_163519 [Guillardia theta CCMP2712]EKX44664.1 hypothetical protein GUITHDRAFT_163519 [Guillardia theta CCMP2712]|eukprot:XP_005831644.1 hypothetical protein GUITHDRAFT_163519 [Guillardia theta CCMP2712]
MENREKQWGSVGVEKNLTRQGLDDNLEEALLAYWRARPELLVRISVQLYATPAFSHHKRTMPKTSKKSEKTKKGASPYNMFMKEELARVKKENPDLDHKKAFKMAAENWSKQKAKK